MDISGCGKQKVGFQHAWFEVLLRYTNRSSNYVRMELPVDFGAKDLKFGSYQYIDNT